MTKQTDVLVVRVDRAPVFNKETLMHALYQACQFPAYFGFNWDALSDLLGRDWLEPAPGGIRLVFNDFALLEQRAPETAATFLEIVREAQSARVAAGLGPLELRGPESA